VHTDPESDEILIRYLRGELAEAERDRLEELYFADDKLHERLVMLEDQMIDSYVRGQLPSDERHRFARLIQDSPEQRRKVEFAERCAGWLSGRPARLHGARGGRPSRISCWFRHQQCGWHSRQRRW